MVICVILVVMETITTVINCDSLPFTAIIFILNLYLAALGFSPHFH